MFDIFSVCSSSLTVDCLFCMHFSRTITWDCSVAEWAVLLWC